MLLPQLKKENGVFNLYVDGKPYIALAGEIHNSSSSDLNYMKQNVWPNLRELHLNTVILPVYWELIEPEQGEFDFHIVDGIIEQAREENVRLVLLWFGLWKNGRSSYVPGWVKKDFKTYYRTANRNKEISDTISPLCEEAVQADASAYRQLMTHLKQIDGIQHTVIMVQVENEIGLLGSDRDYSEIATSAFNLPIPPEIGTAYKKNGTWKEAFQEDAAEYFMAYYYARAVEKIIRAGSEIYPIPMFVNAWLEQYPWTPGTYPSGGPIAKVMKLWKIAAPTVCLYAPDIYLPNFAEICDEYTAGKDNPLFIPEARRDIVSATNVFYAIGKHDALCFAPFGIEDFFAPSEGSAGIDMGLLTALNIDYSGFNLSKNSGLYLARSYELLGNMLGIIQRFRGTGKMTGFLQNQDRGCVLSFSNYDLKITYSQQEVGKPISGGLVIELSEDTFLLAGIGFVVEFLPNRCDTARVGYVRVEEGKFIRDEWVRSRVLNGDEAIYRPLGIGSNPGLLRVELYKFK